MEFQTVIRYMHIFVSLKNNRTKPNNQRFLESDKIEYLVDLFLHIMVVFTKSINESPDIIVKGWTAQLVKNKVNGTVVLTKER